MKHLFFSPCFLRRLFRGQAFRFSSLLIFFFVLASCNRPAEKANRPFEFYFDFENEISRLEKENPLVKKTVTKNGKTETINGTIQWENELALFSRSDINKPHLKNSYEIETFQNDSIKTIKYSAKEGTLPVKVVEYSYSGNEIFRIFIIKEVNNFITKSKYELTYFPKKKYSISGSQSVSFFYDEKFLAEGVLLAPGEGPWRAALQIGEGDLPVEIPFRFILAKKSGTISVEILNAEEKIFCKEVSLRGDSFFIRMPVFDSELKGKIFSDSLIKGAWFNYSKGSDYIVPFYAEYGKPFRSENEMADVKIQYPGGILAGKWEVDFSPGTKSFYKAIGIFDQKDGLITGTFLTETGDYRFLEGTFINDTLLLSCFDGSHAFLFRATLMQDGSKEPVLQGTFFSGTHWKEQWKARKNEKAKLSDPDSLTFLKPGFDQLTFSFPDLDSNIVSLSDKIFQNKVVIIQVMGSWCPNCLDETVFLSEIYQEKHGKGLEIVALSFERNPDFTIAKQAVKRFKEQLNAPYEFLIAGAATTAKAQEALPMLNHIMSFPTTIYIDKSGKVRKIHTGFYGPGTGEYFTKFKEETLKFVEGLLEE